MCNLRHKSENAGYEEYCYKVIKSGKHTEVYIYHDKIFKRRTKRTNELIKEINNWDITENQKELSKLDKEEIEDSIVEQFEKVKKDDMNVRRSQRRLRRLINANVGEYDEIDKFLTLTCPGLKSREKACRMFKSFIKTLRYNYGNQIEYIAVMEIQDGGRLENPELATGDIHFHVLLFNCPYVPQEIMQNKLWKKGIVDIRKIELYGDIAGYLANYLSKDDILCVKGKRSYFPSRGLKKSIEEISMTEDMIFELLSNGSNEVQYTSNYYVDRVGKIGYIKLKSIN